jgi:tetratricopeptide (TPR) repeat protein
VWYDFGMTRRAWVGVVVCLLRFACSARAATDGSDVARYAQAEAAEQQRIVEGLSHPNGYGSIGELALWELKQGDRNGPALAAVRAKVGEVTSEMLVAGKSQEVLKLLRAVVAFSNQESWRGAMETYAWFVLAEGKLKEEAAWWGHGVQKVAADRSRQVTTQLLYMMGDWDDAIQLAQSLGDEKVLNAVNWKRREYASIAEMLSAREEKPRKTGTWGGLAGCYKLAGNQAKCDETLKEIAKCGTETGEHIQGGWILISLDRPDEALKFWLDVGHYDEAFQMLYAQEFFTEAFKLVDELPNDRIERPGYLRMAAATALIDLAKKDEALKQMELALTENDSKKEFEVAVLIAEMQQQLGQKEEAHDVLLRALSWGKKDEPTRETLEKVVGDCGVDWRKCWDYFGKGKFEWSDEEKLKRMSEIAENKGMDTMKAMIEAIDREEGSGKSAYAGLPQWVAKRMKESGDAAGAEQYLLSREQDSGGEQCLSVLAEWAAEEKQWARLADLSERIWRREPSSIYPLVRRAWALGKLGKTDEAKAAAELAYRIVRVEDWITLYDTFMECDLPEFAQREQEAILTILPPDDWRASVMMRHRAEGAADGLESARDWEASNLAASHNTCSHSSVTWYLRYAANVHWARAKGLIQKGDIGPAMAEVEDGVRVFASDDDPVIEIVKQLRAAGHKDEAEHVAKEVFQRREGAIEWAPDSAQRYNSAAWLGGSCGIELERSLEHAKKAVEISPKDGDFWDTLARVLMALGRSDEGLEAQRKAVELKPRDAGIAKHLAEYEKRGK